MHLVKNARDGGKSIKESFLGPRPPPPFTSHRGPVYSNLLVGDAVAEEQSPAPTRNIASSNEGLADDESNTGDVDDSEQDTKRRRVSFRKSLRSDEPLMGPGGSDEKCENDFKSRYSEEADPDTDPDICHVCSSSRDWSNQDKGHADDDIKTGPQIVVKPPQMLLDSKSIASMSRSKGNAFDKLHTSATPGVHETPEIKAIYEEFNFDANFARQALSLLEYLVWQCNRTLILSLANATRSYQDQTEFNQLKINEVFRHTNFNAYAREFVLFRLFDKKVLSGKEVKGQMISKLKLAVTSMSPIRHRDLLSHAWDSAIASFVKKTPNEKLTPNFPTDLGVTLVRNLFSSNQNMQLYTELTGKCTFFDLLEKHAVSLDAETLFGEGGATWIIWPISMKNTNLDDFQLYLVDEVGYVTDKKSIFYGLRRATTRQELVSVYYYFIVASIARLTEKTLPVELGGLLFSCKRAEAYIRDGAQGDTGNPLMLADLFSSVFKSKTGVEAVVLTSYLFGAFGAKFTNRVGFSYLRAVSLITKILYQTMVKYIAADCNVRAMPLSIAGIIAKSDQSFDKESLPREGEENMQYEDFDWTS